MPLNTYDSPQGLAPNIGYKPEGFLGGYLFDQRNEDYKQALAQSTLAKQLGLQDEMNKQETYKLEAPVREATRLKDITKAGVDTTTYGDIQKNAVAKGRIETANEDTQIKAKLSTLTTQISEDQRKIFEREAGDMLTVGKALSSITGEGLEADAKRQEILGSLSQQYPHLKLDPKNPSAIQSKIKVAEIHKQLQDEDFVRKEKAKGEASKYTADQARASALDVAKEHTRAWQLRISNIEQKDKTLQASFNTLNKKHALAVEGKGEWTKGDSEAFQNVINQMHENNLSRVMGPAITGAVGNREGMGAHAIAQSAGTLLPTQKAPAAITPGQGQPAAQPQAQLNPKGLALAQEAKAAIAKGKDPAAVRARFKQMTGQDLP